MKAQLNKVQSYAPLCVAHSEAFLPPQNGR
nr:MAG TPA_asm: hypothetical protein [Caudoviricetes sp.]